jgi:hypothetical protein
MESGTYTFFSKAAGRYLSHSDRTLILHSNPLRWTLKSSGKNGFYVYAQDTSLLLDIHNAWVTSGNTVKLWEHTGYDVQIWSVAKNPNGTHSILHSADPRYCLGFDSGRAVLQLRNRQNPWQEWVVTNVESRQKKEYLSFFSKCRVVELQLPTDIHSIISADRLQLWADRLAQAYNAFYQLTGYLPFQNITVEAYKPAPNPGYAGWVYPHSNTIHIDRTFLYRDLAKMNIRREDWNFCALHEMGHMFDFGKPWTFEPELMTDLKVAYVMEKCNASAAPSEFAASVCFCGKEIARAYDRLGGDFSKNYNIFGCAKRFLDIKDQIGWMPFQNAFHYLQQNSIAYAKISEPEKFLLFVKTLSNCSGREIQAYFSSNEWNTILRHTGKNA